MINKTTSRQAVALIITSSLLGIYSLPIFADNNTAYNNSFTCTDAVNVMDCIEKSKAIEAATPQPTTPTAFTATPWFNFGPLSAEARYDNVLGWIPEINYVQTFYDNGINLRFGYGPNEKRANITLGHSFTAQQQVKLTYEYLTQNLPFDFVSGSTNEWVNQNAFGGAYRYLFFNNIFHSLDLSGYYIHANNKDLDDVIFYQDNNNAALNLRRIAGGTEETVTGGFTLMPWRQLLLEFGGGYSHLIYDTEYEDDQNTTTVAFNADLNLLITAYTKLTAGVANSAAETDSTVKFSQIFPAHIEAAVSAQYSQGQAGQPNSSNITFGLSYPVAPYTLDSQDTLSSLKAWVQEPVILAPRVLAIKDEKVIPYAISETNPPAQILQTGAGIQPVYTTDIFNFDPKLFDKVVYLLSVAPNSNNITNPQTQLFIDVKPDGSSPYNSIIYSTAPLPNSLSPDNVDTYDVVITAVGYKSNLAQPVQSQATLELEVHFNSNNEPQWDQSKTTGTIAFDQTTANANAINLNSYLNSSSNTTAVKFSLVGSYSYYDVKQDSQGTWYLVRKTAADGSFYAGDIGSSKATAVTIQVKYADDPANAPGNSQTITVTAANDNKIALLWSPDAGCVLNGGAALPAMQPNNNTTYAQDLTKCIQYTNGSNTIKVSGDSLTPTVTNSHNYLSSGTFSYAVNQLTVPGPTGGLGVSYSLDLNIKSTARDGTSGQGTALTATNFIIVGKTLTLNSSSGMSPIVFNDGSGVNVGAVVVSNLSASQIYQVTQATFSGKLAECPGKVTTKTDFDACSSSGQLQNVSLNQNLPLPPDSSGQITLMAVVDDNSTPILSALTIQQQ